MSHTVFDIIPENPQIEHIAQQVKPPAMQEHRTKDIEEITGKICCDQRRDDARLEKKRIQLAHTIKHELVQKNDHVNRDQQPRYNRLGL